MSTGSWLGPIAVHRLNNFDLIRLLAAVQVFFMHSVVWLKLPISPMVAEVVDWFPGVPVFFMISGVLVTHSFVRLPTLRQYLRHRALRIFPALWVCLAISFLLAAWQGNLTHSSLFLQTVIWAVMQGSFFQFVNFYVNPGVTNGVLWSIATELQFYIVLPLLISGGSHLFKGKARISVALIALAAASSAFHAWNLSHQAQLLPKLFPIFYASVLANGYLFIFGALAYLWQDRLHHWCQDKFLIFLAIYLIVRSTLFATGIPAYQLHSSMLGMLVYPLLGLVIYSFAFSFQGLSQRILKGNDFSYGIYIYHMPVIYALIHLKIEGASGLALATIAVASLAALSWLFIERPALSLKREEHSPATRHTWIGARR